METLSLSEAKMKLSELVERVQSTDAEIVITKNRLSSKQITDIVAIGPRKTIYEETYRIIRKESNA